MSEDPEVIPHPPAPEISDKEFPVPQDVLVWEQEHIPLPPEEPPA